MFSTNACASRQPATQSSVPPIHDFVIAINEGLGRLRMNPSNFIFRVA